MGNGVAAEILLMLAGDFPGGSRNTHLNRPEGPKIPVESQAPSLLVSVSIRDLTFNRGELDLGAVRATVPLHPVSSGYDASRLPQPFVSRNPAADSRIG